MFENLTYEKFKKTESSQMFLDNIKAMQDAKDKFQNDLLKGRKMKLDDAKVINKKNEEIQKEYEKKLADKQAKANASATAYRKMWGDVLDVVEKDPVLTAYKQKHQLNSTSAALTQLADQYGKETPLGKQLLSMRNLVTSLKGVCELDQVKDGFEIDLSGKNLMQAFIRELNNVNGKTVGSDETKKSLSEEAYQQLEDTQYKDVEKNQDLLLPVHLGQICSDLVTQVTIINTTAPLLHGEDDLMKKETVRSNFEDFVNGFPGDPEEFFSGKDAELEKQQKIVDEYTAFKADRTQNSKAVQEKYKDYLENAVTHLSSEEIQQTYEAEIKTRKDKLEKLRQEELDLNESTKRLNEDKKQRHQNDLKFNQGVRQNMEDAEKDKKQVLGEFDKQIQEKEDADRKYMEEREQQAKEQEQKWADYDKKLADAKKDLAAKESAIAQRNKLEAELSRLAPKGNELGELKTAQRMKDTFLSMITAIEKPIVGDYKTSMIIANAALKSKNLDFNDITAVPKERQENVMQAIKVQAAWEAFKLEHTNYSSFFHNVDGFKGEDVYKGEMEASEEPGPMDELYSQMKLWEDKVAKLEKVVNPYLSAKKKVEDLNKANDGSFVTEEEVDAKRKEVEELTKNTPEAKRFDRQAWDKETKAGLDKDLQGLKDKRKLEEQAYANQLESLKAKLRDEKEPSYFPVKTEEEIQKIVDAEEKKILGEEALKGLKADITKKVRPKYKEAALDSLDSHLHTKSYNANSKIKAINDTSDKINNMFAADKARMADSQVFTDGLKAQAKEFGNRKDAVYSSIAGDLNKYFSNMEKGKKAGHNNSEEFTKMVESVKKAADMFDPEKKHTEAEQLKALEDMKEAADFYKTKKEHDFHIDFFASSMRHVRLNMAADLSRFAADKTKQLQAFAKYSDGMKKHLEDYKPEASVFDVKQDEKDAASHFKRVFKTVQQAKQAKQQAKQFKAAKESIEAKSEKQKHLQDDTEIKKSNTEMKLGF